MAEVVDMHGRRAGITAGLTCSASGSHGVFVGICRAMGMQRGTGLQMARRALIVMSVRLGDAQPW